MSRCCVIVIKYADSASQIALPTPIDTKIRTFQTTESVLTDAISRQFRLNVKCFFCELSICQMFFLLNFTNLLLLNFTKSFLRQTQIVKSAIFHKSR